MIKKYSNSENTKAAIIDAAGNLASELGLDNVSTRAVAERSGENIGSIHYHFGGKDGLFEAVVRNAMGGCCHTKYDQDAIDALGENASREELSAVVRELIAKEINGMFRSNNPEWHPQVIYQLLQRDDALYDIFRAEVLDPSMNHASRFFKLIDPDMTDDEAFLHNIVMKMPIFAHASYRKVMLKRLGVATYSDEYLLKLENLLVKQTQLSLGLPLV